MLKSWKHGDESFSDVILRAGNAKKGAAARFCGALKGTDTAGFEIAWSTLHQFWPEFMKLEIVVHTRKIGRAELFKLNSENPLVKKLLEIDMIVSRQMIDKEIEQQKVIA